VHDPPAQDLYSLGFSIVLGGARRMRIAAAVQVAQLGKLGDKLSCPLLVLSISIAIRQNTLPRSTAVTCPMPPRQV
jgi:hypothetical protein